MDQTANGPCVQTVLTRGVHDYVCRSFPLHVARAVGSRRVLSKVEREMVA